MGLSPFRSPPQKPAKPRCPICKAPADPDLHPFCSTRCADVDLARWLNGAYAIPGGQQDADEDGEAAQVAQETGAAPGGEGHEN